MPKIPETMNAVVLDQFGGIDELSIRTVPVPETGSGQILISVHTAGVGVWDPAEREGEMADLADTEPSFPYIPGSDAAGTVVQVGKEVGRFERGDRVYATTFLNPKGGGYAEYVAVDADRAMPVPDTLEMGEAGAFPVDAATALRGLRDELEIGSGDALAVYGASGGVGHMAVQFAVRMGARVVAIASKEDGVELATDLGAERAVDGRSGDVPDVVEGFAPTGLDAVLVTAYGDSLGAVLERVREGGRVAWPHGVQPEPEVPEGVTGSAYNADPGPDLLQEMNRLAEIGSFRVHVDRTFPMADVKKAHRALDEHYLGKLALTIRG